MTIFNFKDGNHWWLETGNSCALWDENTQHHWTAHLKMVKLINLAMHTNFITIRNKWIKRNLMEGKTMLNSVRNKKTKGSAVFWCGFHIPCGTERLSIVFFSVFQNPYQLSLCWELQFYILVSLEPPQSCINPHEYITPFNSLSSFAKYTWLWLDVLFSYTWRNTSLERQMLGCLSQIYKSSGDRHRFSSGSVTPKSHTSTATSSPYKLELCFG